MRIRRLEITGFKSFMERSIFRFDERITGVVGPNGCGKSNVVDAIRWVMGEQSAKNLRGRGMEDVIFNGSETCAPLNMAEVSLTFRVEERDVLAEPYQGFPEITVTRRLFRDGTSEYLINKSTCRLLDIVELFLGTGVGKSAYSIIEQGRVGLIVSSKPEDRRQLIEEAAGITKYKSRRKAAERKLEYTQQNLLRVSDLTSELEKRLESLARQARKAEKYKKLKGEIRELDLHLASVRHHAFAEERAGIAERLASANGEEKAGLERLEGLEAAIAQRRVVLEAEEASLLSLSEEVHRLESQLAQDGQRLEHWAEDEKATRARIAEAEAEQAALEVEKEAALAERARKEAELDGLSGSWKEDESALEAAQEALERVEQARGEAANWLEQERAALVAIAARLANHESNLASLARQKAELASRLEALEAESRALAEQERELDGTRTDVAQKVDESRRSALELGERRTQEEAELTRTREAFAENEIGVISLRETLSDERSRLASLREIQRSYEGFDRGVRAVMLRAGDVPREAGIFGVLAEVVSSTPELEKAIEAALGERLQHVLVESVEKGFELAAHLEAAAEGRGSFFPVPGPTEQFPLVEPDLDRPGVVAAAWKVVETEEALRPVVSALLGSVVIVRDLETARACLLNPPVPVQPEPTYVTLDGQVVRPDGTVSGGVLEGPAVGALRKRREIAELEIQVGKTEARYNDTLTRHYGFQKQIERLEGLLQHLAKNQHQEELSLATQEKDLHRAGEELSRVRERLASVETERARLVAQKDAFSAEEEASRGEVAHGQTDRAAREEKVRALTAELESLKERATTGQADLTDLKVKVASHSERGDATRKEIDRLRAQTEGLESRFERARAALAEGARHLEMLTAQRAEVEPSRASTTERHHELSQSLETRREGQREEKRLLHEQEEALERLRADLNAIGSGLAQLSLRDRELELELSHLQDSVRERHTVELEAELPRFVDLPLPDGAESRASELRSSLERMGEINLTAIEEHQELSTRYEFLAGQKRDLEGSIARLREAIVKIDATSRERFTETFRVIDDKFQQVFPRLFGGGRAQLLLTGEGTAEQGVEIVAQPPGKKLQSVGLLSGGEKALTAVGLIFSIFLIKPTPFCLLDEVDAPLDEGNVGRYNEMVREMSHNSQFILITHNKRTMEVADLLYGVTMQEPGISKLVSVKLEAAEGREGAESPEIQAAG